MLGAVISKNNMEDNVLMDSDVRQSLARAATRDRVDGARPIRSTSLPNALLQLAVHEGTN